MLRKVIFIFSVLSISALADSTTEKSDRLKQAEEQLAQTKEKVKKMCEERKERVIKRPECSAKHAEAAAIDCSSADNPYKKAFEMELSCMKKKALTSEEKEKLKAAIADLKKANNEIVKCEAFDEQGASAGTLDAAKKDCRRELEKKVDAERCKSGERKLLKFKFTAGREEKKSLMILCRRK